MEECLVFQQNKFKTIKTSSLLQPLAIPCQFWEEVSMDFITGLHKYEGKSFIMVVFYRLTKYAQFCTLSHPFKANIVITTLMEIVQNIHRNQNTIISDKYLILTRNFWTKIFFLPWYSISSYLILSSSIWWGKPR